MLRALVSAIAAIIVIGLPVLALGWYVEFGTNSLPTYWLAARVWNLPAGLGAVVGLSVAGAMVLANGQTERRRQRLLRAGEAAAVAAALLGEVAVLLSVTRGRFHRLHELAPRIQPTERIRVPAVTVARTVAGRPDLLRLLPADAVENLAVLYGRLDELNVMVSDMVSANRLAPESELMRGFETVIALAERVLRSLASFADLRIPDLDAPPHSG